MLTRALMDAHECTLRTPKARDAVILTVSALCIGSRVRARFALAALA
jgi:hypothetical protein